MLSGLIAARQRIRRPLAHNSIGRADHRLCPRCAPIGAYAPRQRASAPVQPSRHTALPERLGLCPSVAPAVRGSRVSAAPRARAPAPLAGAPLPPPRPPRALQGPGVPEPAVRAARGGFTAVPSATAAARLPFAGPSRWQP
jgi:hypothetical protein